MLEQIACDEVHPLAVPNRWISFHESVQNIPEWIDVFLHMLRRVVRESTLQVQLNLIEARVWIVDVVITKNVIIVVVELLVQ